MGPSRIHPLLTFPNQLPYRSYCEPMPTNYITLTRQELYDMVWAKLMSSLANGFSISDVGLAKRCRAVDVPIPYRGYWARKAAGQRPPKLPLPKYGTKSPRQAVRNGPEPIVPFTISTGRIKREASTSDELPSYEQVIQARLSALSMTPAIELAETCATVRRTAKHHKCRGRGAIPLTAAER